MFPLILTGTKPIPKQTLNSGADGNVFNENLAYKLFKIIYNAKGQLYRSAKLFCAHYKTNVFSTKLHIS